MNDQVTTTNATCTCCQGRQAYTPVAITNRPGQDVISRRVGTHGRFKQTMLARLSSEAYRALRKLTTRDDDDVTIALLDAWASVADVLSFYQERIANEGYLRTAQERFSLTNLARAIGYEPRPGVAAKAYVAFTVEDAKGAPLVTTVDAGTKIQSVPNPGERPQTFETSETIEARAAWNAMKPVTTAQQDLSTSMTEAVVQGVETRLRSGDRMVIVDDDDNRAVVQVVAATPDPKKNTTRIQFKSVSQLLALTLQAYAIITYDAAGVNQALNSQTMSDVILASTWEDQNDLIAYATESQWPLTMMVEAVNYQLAAAAKPAVPGPTPSAGLFAMRQRASIFGHNAPQYSSLPRNLRVAETVKVKQADGTYGSPEVREAIYPTSWEGKTLAQDDDDAYHVYLDTVYSEAIPGSWIALESTGGTKVVQVADNKETSRSDYTLSAKVSQLQLASETNLDTALSAYTVRGTTVHLQSEALSLVPVPLTGPLSGNNIQLDRFYDGLQVGQPVIVSGEDANLPGITVHDVVIIKAISTPGGRTHLEFETDLDHDFVLDTVTVNANVALATHGETQADEALGSGDGATTYQTFSLPQKPLTYVPAGTSTGTATTLQVRVNGILWSERATLYGAGPQDRVYVTQRQEDGTTNVKFGDGVTGRRLPTSLENVRATYRKGIGLEGLVGAGQLTLLQQRPHGVRGVTNPAAAYGAADPESEANIRTNATLGIRTLGRIVSLQDYEDFARAFAGVVKALATWTWTGQGRGIYVTVAGADGAAVTDDDLDRLVSEMKKAGDPLVPVAAASYTRCSFQIDADISVDAAYVEADVLTAVEAALRDRFAFDQRQFGQAVAASEVIAAMHAVEGVIAVDLNALWRTGTTKGPAPTLAATVPRAGAAAGDVQPAELLLLDARPVSLGVMT